VSGLKWKIHPTLVDDSLNIHETERDTYIIGEDYSNKDAMERIQHTHDDEEKSEQSLPVLQSLFKLNQARQSNDFETNSKLRDAHRKLRKAEQTTSQQVKRLGSSFVSKGKILLPEETQEDEIIAKQEFATRNIQPSTKHNSITNSMQTSNRSFLTHPKQIISLAQEIKKRKNVAALEDPDDLQKRKKLTLEKHAPTKITNSLNLEFLQGYVSEEDC